MLFLFNFRFFFLSNHEILEILSETKYPLQVQPHLNKLFSGINSLEFDEHLCIKAMFSEQGEKIDFVSPVYTKSARGSVEKWLVQVYHCNKLVFEYVMYYTMDMSISR